MYGESQVSFLENSLQMGDALFYSLNLFSEGVFRLIANPIACLSFFRSEETRLNSSHAIPSRMPSSA